MEMEVEQFGSSKYDYHYMSCRCAYCNKVVILEHNLDTLEILYQEELENQRNLRNDPSFYHTASEAKRERQAIMEREEGAYVAHEQCLHYRCLVVLQQDEKKGDLARLELANRRNIELPNTEKHYFYELNYTNVLMCLNKCAFCRLCITRHATGFAYCEKTDNLRKGHYLHHACFDALSEERCHARKLEAQNRRQFLHFLTTTSAENQWKSLSVEKLAARNEAWLTFLSKYELNVDERDTLFEWIEAGGTRLFDDTEPAKKWDEHQKCVWRANTTEDILSLFFTDIGQLKDEELDEKEKETIASSSPSPYLLQCTIPVPEILPSIYAMPLATTDKCIRYTPVPLPGQLILNLIKTLRQARRELRILEERRKADEAK